MMLPEGDTDADISTSLSQIRVMGLARRTSSSRLTLPTTVAAFSGGQQRRLWWSAEAHPHRRHQKIKNKNVTLLLYLTFV